MQRGEVFIFEGAHCTHQPAMYLGLGSVPASGSMTGERK